jgi:hypothetical protein
MYPGLSGEAVASRQIKDIDMLRDSFLFDVGRNFMAVPANDHRMRMLWWFPQMLVPSSVSSNLVSKLQASVCPRALFELVKTCVFCVME